MMLIWWNQNQEKLQKIHKTWKVELMWGAQEMASMVDLVIIVSHFLIEFNVPCDVNFIDSRIVTNNLFLL